MRSLYNEYGMMVTDDGNEIYDKVYAFLEEITKDFMSRGYSIREIGGVIHSICAGMIADIALREATEKHMKLRKNK